MPRQRQSTRTSKMQFRHEGTPSVFTCPDCQGTLFLLENGNLKRFRCRTGHMYSPESMLEAQNDNIERLMWAAVRALDEHAEYLYQLAGQITHADRKTAQHYKAMGNSSERTARVVRRLITRGTEERNHDGAVS